MARASLLLHPPQNSEAAPPKDPPVSPVLVYYRGTLYSTSRLHAAVESGQARVLLYTSEIEIG